MFFFIFTAWNPPLLLTHFTVLTFGISLHQNSSFRFLSSLFLLMSSVQCPIFWLCNSYLWVFRLNNLKRAAADTLEGNKSVTYMDLRDNQMTDLDLSSLGSLEQLHCERNKLKELTLSGFSLRALYASSNCMSLCLLHLPSSFKPWEQRKTALCSHPHKKNTYTDVTVVKLYVMGLLGSAPRNHIRMYVHRLCNRGRLWCWVTVQEIHIPVRSVWESTNKSTVLPCSGGPRGRWRDGIVRSCSAIWQMYEVWTLSWEGWVETLSIHKVRLVSLTS